jgi:hypothetical protein
VLDEQFVFRGLLDGAGDALAVLGSEDEGPQDQQVERALEQLEAVAAFSGRHMT